MKTDQIIGQIKTIFWTILGAMGIILIVALLIAKNIGSVIDWTLTQKENLKSIILILALGGIPASYFFHSKKVKHIAPDLPIEKKLIQFKTSFFIKIVTLEALSILGLLAYMLTADNTFLYVFALLLLAYILNRPTRHNILNEIEPEEIEEPE